MPAAFLKAIAQPVGRVEFRLKVRVGDKEKVEGAGRLCRGRSSRGCAQRTGNEGGSGSQGCGSEEVSAVHSTVRLTWVCYKCCRFAPDLPVWPWPGRRAHDLALSECSWKKTSRLLRSRPLASVGPLAGCRSCELGARARSSAFCAGRRQQSAGFGCRASLGLCSLWRCAESRLLPLRTITAKWRSEAFIEWRR